MSSLLQTIYIDSVTAMGIAFFLWISTGRSRAFSLLGYFAVAFLADLLTPAPFEYLSLPAILLFLLAYIRYVLRKEWTDTLYMVGTTAMVHILAVIVSGLPVWNLFPQIYETQI